MDVLSMLDRVDEIATLLDGLSAFLSGISESVKADAVFFQGTDDAANAEGLLHSRLAFLVREHLEPAAHDLRGIRHEATGRGQLDARG